MRVSTCYQGEVASTKVRIQTEREAKTREYHLHSHLSLFQQLNCFEDILQSQHSINIENNTRTTVEAKHLVLIIDPDPNI